MIEPFSDEQSRALINLEQRYHAYIACERDLAALPYDLRRKEVGGRAYLYQIRDRSGNGTSLGPWSDEHQKRFDDYHAQKADLKSRRETLKPVVEEAGKIARAVRAPMLASDAGAILREADIRGLLGSMVLVVGTNAMPAYAVEAGGFIRSAPDETQDFDLTWSAPEPLTDGQPLWSMLKAVDSTFTVNLERSFQARNAKAYEVEILCAPSRVATMPQRDQPRPFPLPEQEWLLFGRPVDRVLVCRDGTAARVVAPDPRWFALQKLWMSRQAKRNPLKRPKDLKQGMALLDAVRQTMPQYPLDAAFEAEIPDMLQECYADWRAQSRP